MHELVSGHMSEPCGSRNPQRFILVFFVAKSKITQKKKVEQKIKSKYLDGGTLMHMYSQIENYKMEWRTSNLSLS